MQPARVLISAFHYAPGGVSEGYLAAKWREGLSRHCQVDLITGDSQEGDGVYVPFQRFRPRNAFLRRVNATFKFDYFLFDRRSAALLADRIRDYDIFHHIAPQAPRYPVTLGRHARQFVIGPVAGGLRVPPAFRKEVEGSEEFFFKLRALDTWRLKHDRQLLRTYEAAAAIVVAGDYLREILPARFHGRFHRMLDVGVDMESYPFHQRHRDEGKLRLAFVGRVVPYKGLIYLLRALACLSKVDRKLVQLTIAGNRDETEYEKKCRRFVVEEGLEEMVTFRGYLPREDINCLLAESHLFCFPSLAEAGGAAVVEALATGLPVIGADLGGPGESVTPECGAKVGASSPEELVVGLAEAIKRFVDGTRSLPEASSAARKRAEDWYDWKVKARRMFSIYQGL